MDQSAKRMLKGCAVMTNARAQCRMRRVMRMRESQELQSTMTVKEQK